MTELLLARSKFVKFVKTSCFISSIRLIRFNSLFLKRVGKFSYSISDSYLVLQDLVWMDSCSLKKRWFGPHKILYNPLFP